MLLLCVRESWFVIRKRIQNRSSDAQIRLKNERDAREKQGGQRPWPCHHVWSPCATRPNQPSNPMWHTCPTRGKAGLVLIFCGQKYPSSFLFKSLQFPSFVSKKKNCEIPSMFFSPIFSTSKHHNFLIRSRNWVIQVGDCSYSSPLPFPSDLAAVWLIFGVIYSENRISSWNQGSDHILVISSF